MPEIGQIVYSKAGRDKRQLFVVVSVDAQYAYLADGVLRKLDKPKKKKHKHIQKTNVVLYELRAKLESNKALDADIEKGLKNYVKKGEEPCQKLM